MTHTYRIWYTDSELGLEVTECEAGTTNPEGMTSDEAAQAIHEQLHENGISVAWVSVLRMQDTQPTLTDHIADCAIGVLSLMRRVFAR